MLQHANRSVSRFSLLLLLLLSTVTSGCGVVGNKVTKALAYQGDPGPLYSGDFYKTATPEQVRQAIGSRSLARESFTRKSYHDLPGGASGPALNIGGIVDIFWPLGYIRRDEPIYPIGVAVWNTPYPEVISLMFQAGATMEQVRLFRYLDAWKDNEHNREILRLLLENGSTEDRTLALESMVCKNNREMVDFILASYSEVQVACVRGNRLIGKAVRCGRNDMAVYLRQRGLYAAPTPQEELKLLGQVLDEGNYEGFRLLVNWGYDYTRIVDGKNNLFTIALERRNPAAEPTLLAQLAQVAEGDTEERDEMLRATCRLPDSGLLSIFISRGMIPPKGDKRWIPLLRSTLEHNRPNSFLLLVRHGADCSVGDTSLLTAARWGEVQDKRVLKILADTFPGQ